MPRIDLTDNELQTLTMLLEDAHAEHGSAAEYGIPGFGDPDEIVRILRKLQNVEIPF